MHTYVHKHTYTHTYIIQKQTRLKTVRTKTGNATPICGEGTPKKRTPQQYTKTMSHLPGTKKTLTLPGPALQIPVYTNPGVKTTPPKKVPSLLAGMLPEVRDPGIREFRDPGIREFRIPGRRKVSLRLSITIVKITARAVTAILPRVSRLAAWEQSPKRSKLCRLRSRMPRRAAYPSTCCTVSAATLIPQSIIQLVRCVCLMKCMHQEVNVP